MNKAVYAFSGDPITFGHIDIVKRASRVFDQLIVAIGRNPDKYYTFSLQEREQMARQALAPLNLPLEVTSFEGLLVDFAYENGASVIIKGIRNSDDYSYELLLHQIGQSQKLDIDTFLLPAQQNMTHIRSSMVKAIQKEHGFVHEYVPLHVKERLEAKISGQYIVGVTGEIGVGKSFVCEKFVELGKQQGIEVHNIDMDQITHEILNELPDPAYKKLREQISETFDSEIPDDKGILDQDGMICRKTLGNIVFRNKEKLQKLNKLMRLPLLIRLRKKLLGKKGLILLNAALLAETQMLYMSNNNIVLIGSEKPIQKQRLQERDLNADQIEKRIQSQYNTQEKKASILKQQKSDSFGQLWEIDNSSNGENPEINRTFSQILEYFKLTT
jgi:pantetheine-phosphate adenylyltransferase